MRLKGLLGLGAIILLCSASPGYADLTAGSADSHGNRLVRIHDTPSGGGTIALPKTGQVKCHNEAGTEIACAGTGQDGEHQEGAAWPNPRFTAGAGAEAACVTDNLTGLMWAKDAHLGGTKAWYEANTYVAGLSLCGHNDWRLPNAGELVSLMHAGQADNVTWLASNGFTNVQSYYWLSTTRSNSTAKAWLIWTGDGGIYSDVKASLNYAWPVRAGLSAIAQTGQKKCYDSAGAEIPCAGTGQDGEHQAGAAWPNPRFTVAGTRVTDNLTGLMWTKDAGTPGLPAPAACNPGGERTWQQALDHVSCLNDNDYLGYTDWRLPNREEMRSLVDYSQGTPTLPTGHPFINPQCCYWSSTTRADKTTKAWYISMSNAGSYNDLKTTTALLWPCRTDDGTPPGYPLSVSRNGTGSGTVISAPPGINCGITCSTSFPEGTSVTLSTHPAADSVFDGWSGEGCAGTGTCTVTMTAAKSVTATFKKASYTLITLKNFTAAATGLKVVFQWTTASEFQNAGFYIVKSEYKDSGYSRINTRIIPSKGTVVRGASYSYIDGSVKRGKTYYFKLEDVDNHGKSTFHGPIKVTAK